MDDDESVAKLLKALLKDHQVVIRTNGFETITGDIDWTAIDVVIVDRILGIQDGTHLLRWIRKEHPDILRIMLTGDTAVNVDESPANRVMFKPPDWDELRDAVNG